ncbi:uncharacterized protein LOC126794413 [Argentina anserina]|uniref:uncharacterized protein LOC126794413 n=1 Tax=Argentina anserina TaxID=57926 RepID=UPI00217621E5|nr:uncharacterized protein LOC126794413 [Potentilla anserina]
MKPFIHYDSLIEAFGRDRANGLGAEGPGEADEDLNDNDYVDIEEHGLDENTGSSNVIRTPAFPPFARTRKRARDAYSQCLGDMAITLRSFVDVTNAHLETMQGVLMNEHMTSERRGKIVEELMKIEGINDYDVLDAVAEIIRDDSKINLLFTLPANLKIKWIHNLLAQVRK